MPAYKDEKTGKWYAAFYFTNWMGVKEKKMKRGFTMKRDALEWEREFLQQKNADLTMSFEAFVKIYMDDMKDRIREHTWQTKISIIETKLMPYFKDKKMCDIASKDIIQWQNEMMRLRTPSGKPFSATYLKTLHNQISAIFNHAVRFYELRSNPALKAGSVGRKEATEMLFWTKDEYLKFADSMMDKPLSFYAFEVLYWCGVRLGEMLALTPSDFDFEKNTVSITKSYQRLKGKDVITDPKTPKSKRVIQISDFLSEEIQEYMKSLYGCAPTNRLFPVTKSYLHHEMTRGSKEQGIKRIRIHDLRHSHVSLLIDMGFSAVAIADRLGHESIDITYRYAHLFPSKQMEMAEKLNIERGGF
ncbi:site-specific integrase [Clostridia bacterium OttesenSCG-928-F22]|nr:site-specific integrase [Clostridia bacterium OttesenSCG-928-F22]